MTHIDKINPASLLTDDRIVLIHKEYRSEKKENDYLVWLKDGNTLVLATKILFIYNNQPDNTNIKEWIGGTEIEMPQKGLSWFINTIENKFLKSEKEGGLPKGKFGVDTQIDGEKLVISRMFGTSGYSLRNLARRNYNFEASTEPQEVCFSDELLFEHGFFKQMKELAEKLEKGII